MRLIMPQIEQNKFECKTQSWGYLLKKEEEEPQTIRSKGWTSCHFHVVMTGTPGCSNAMMTIISIQGNT